MIIIFITIDPVELQPFKQNLSVALLRGDLPFSGKAPRKKMLPFARLLLVCLGRLRLL
jgi:hypothetical protein